MRGYFMSVLGIFSMLVFSLLIFVMDKFSLVWLFLELGTLSLVPCFFLYSGSQSLTHLFSYLMVSSVSSSMIVGGLMFDEVFILFVLGFMMKFGVFPFFSWLYNVMVGSNWLVVWGISTILKFPFLILCYFLSMGGYKVLFVLCSISFVLLSVLFWMYTFGWDYCWCHMMLSSSMALVAMSIMLSGDILLFIFLCYFIWSSSVILFFWKIGVKGWRLGSWYLFMFLLISTPISLSIFYKLLVGFGIYSCSFIVLLGWVFYSLSEQLYLFCCLLGVSLPRSGFNIYSSF